jgi:hypothetical protein
MGVDHGRGHARVSEEFLDRADVGSAFQEVGGAGHGVAERSDLTCPALLIDVEVVHVDLL